MSELVPHSNYAPTIFKKMSGKGMAKDVCMDVLFYFGSYSDLFEYLIQAILTQSFSSIVNSRTKQVRGYPLRKQLCPDLQILHKLLLSCLIERKGSELASFSNDIAI